MFKWKGDLTGKWYLDKCSGCKTLLIWALTMGCDIKFYRVVNFSVNIPIFKPVSTFKIIWIISDNGGNIGRSYT